MSNWLKIGLPILIAVLLVVSAVAVTLAVTGGTARQASTVAYQPGNAPAVQNVADYSCHGFSQANQPIRAGCGMQYGCRAWGAYRN